MEGSPLPVTRWSQVVLAGGDDAAGRSALEWLFRMYGEPLRRHVRRAGWRDDEEVLQDFWVALLERRAMGTADAARGRFRSWLLTCLDHFLADRAAAAAAGKRGGGRATAGLPAEDLFADPDATDPAQSFDRAWASRLLTRARERLGGEIDDLRFRTLSPFLLANGDAIAYRTAGAALGLGEGAVKVAVHRLRLAFRQAVRAEIADTLTDPSTSAIDAELADLCAALTR